MRSPVIIAADSPIGLTDLNGCDISMGDRLRDVERNVGMIVRVHWNNAQQCWWFSNGDLIMGELTPELARGFVVIDEEGEIFDYE